MLKQVSFHIEEYEKVAVVGSNGAGKSTLLKIIMHELEPDEGQVVLAKDKTIGYLAQHSEMESDTTLYGEVLEGKRALLDMEEKIRSMEEEMQLAPPDLEALMERYHRLLHEFEAAGGYTFRSEVTGVLKGLGFSQADYDKPCSQLSGGQKTRVSLARLLVSHPDLILLDEPTNHLDIASIAWLENFLLNYKGAVIVVSHDRFFMDRVVSKVVEISMHHCAVYRGNYSAYAEAAEKVREIRQKAYENQQREIRHQEEVIEKLKSFNREKSIRRAQSRQKQLSKIEVLERPSEERTDMRIALTPRMISGKDVLSVEHLSKSFGSKELFADLSFEIKRGERVALIGANGTGKTTILKILNGILDADKGSFTLGSHVQIGYYDQEQQRFHMEKTLFDEISDEYPAMTNTEIRNILAAFLFTEEDVFKLVGDLSGGERGRLALAKLMLSEANLLILDEPTNHLDIVSKEILETALNRYEGTVLFVSHDRYFINRCATRILELEGQKLTEYIGNYEYYLEKKEQLTQASAEALSQPAAEEKPGAAPQPAVSESRAEWKAKKEEQAAARKKASQIRRLEEKIEEMENRLSAIDKEYARPEVAVDPVRLEALHNEQTALTRTLEELYTEWEEIAQ